jgi:hypothetical protein
MRGQELAAGNPGEDGVVLDPQQAHDVVRTARRR